ncbi:MAG: hypothetical protein Kow00109_05220 [Acidobacteriota bacterium]
MANLYATWFELAWVRWGRTRADRVGRAWVALLANAQRFLDGEEAQLLAVRVRWRDGSGAGTLRGSVRLLPDSGGAWRFRVDWLSAPAPSGRRLQR